MKRTDSGGVVPSTALLNEGMIQTLLSANKSETNRNQRFKVRLTTILRVPRPMIIAKTIAHTLHSGAGWFRNGDSSFVVGLAVASCDWATSVDGKDISELGEGAVTPEATVAS